MKKYLISFLTVGLVAILSVQNILIAQAGLPTGSGTGTFSSVFCCIIGPNGGVCERWNTGGRCPDGTLPRTTCSNPCAPPPPKATPTPTPTPVPPPQTGACCYPNGQCEGNIPKTGCTGTYQGDGTTCEPNPCVQATAEPTATPTPEPPPPQEGACCVGSQCEVTSQGNCESNIGGTYKGNGTQCEPNNPCAFDCSLCGTPGYPCTEYPCESQCQDQCFGNRGGNISGQSEPAPSGGTTAPATLDSGATLQY